jgi:maltose alpha-D-glucosyltransferase / alpha-amylase
VLQQFVRNQGDAWRFTLETLKRELDTLVLSPEREVPPIEEAFGTYFAYAATLGRRTAELHRALAIPTDDPAFAIEPLNLADVEGVARDARSFAERALKAVERLNSGMSESARVVAERFLENHDACVDLIATLTAEPLGAVKSRIHGDYHLGQVLIVQNDVMIVDFEGEPSRSADERRAKASPIRDVAGMLRSFAYAADTVIRDLAGRFGRESAARASALATGWQRLAERSFLAAYAEAAAGSPAWVENDATRARLLRLHLLAKALYEVDYEASNRPDWIETPMRGVLSILDERETPHAG